MGEKVNIVYTDMRMLKQQKQQLDQDMRLLMKCIFYNLQIVDGQVNEMERLLVRREELG